MMTQTQGFYIRNTDASRHWTLLGRFDFETPEQLEAFAAGLDHFIEAAVGEPVLSETIEANFAARMASERLRAERSSAPIERISPECEESKRARELFE